jgi:hypothetical protein
MRQPLEKLPRPCGILTKDDIAAVWTLRILNQLGIRCPDEMPILGISDDIVFCHMMDPPLSSIPYSGKRIGLQAATLLHRMMSGDVTKCANGIRGAACRWQAGWLSRERTEFEEKFLPTADDDLAAFDLAEGDDAPELGGERLVVSEEKHALAVALAGMAEGEFEGVPGFTGPGAAVDEELAILRKLVKQGESLPSRHDLAIFLLSRHYLAIITP